jgi:mono/diheme cytochrome c family protein
MSNLLLKIAGKSKWSYLLFVVFFLSGSFAFSQPDGEQLFKTKCASCHSIGSNKVVGPGLQGVSEKYEQEWLLKWIKNNVEFQKEDALARQVFEENGKLAMNTFPELSDEDVIAILDYIANPPVDQAAAGGGAGDGSGAGVAQEEDPMFSMMLLIGIVVLLIVITSLLRNVKFSLTKLVAEKTGETAPEDEGVLKGFQRWAEGNKKIVALLLIGVLAFGAKAGWDSLLKIGVYEGYKPEQPIKFSHEIHAGINKIDCNYCHSSARHSKTSGIPSANVCMNCHKYISEGQTTGTEEIAKIYKALDYDPVAQTYGDNPMPIKWVKVHNLPDHVFFSHAQHVSIGGIECQKCHGPVEKMPVVEQYAPLTMGWCIDCHRETGVKMEGNGYYDEIHSRLPAHFAEEYMKDGKITVDELGGIECAKCHY